MATGAAQSNGSDSGSSTAGQAYTSTGGQALTGTAGADTFNASDHNDTLTGGAGNDVFAFPVEPWSPIRITDFVAGSDKLDLSALFQTYGYAGSDPVADKWIWIVSDGAGGTIVRFDRDGAGTSPQWPNTIIDLEHVSPTGLTWSQLAAPTGASPTATGGGAGAGSAGGEATDGQVYTSRTTYSTLTGAGGRDTFNASEAGDTLTGGAGADVFHFGAKPWDPVHITDFEVGVDKLDLSSLLRRAGYTGSDAIGDRYVSFADNGAGGTKVMFDRDGAGGGQPWPDRIIELDNLRYDPAAASQMLTASGPITPASGAFVLFAGQSNMGGAYTTAGNVDPAWKPDPLTMIWQPFAHAWVKMDPGVNTGWSTAEEHDAWGPEVEFAIKFRAAYPDTPLYIVKDVHGGTNLYSEWNPGNAGHLFDEVTALVADAGSALGGRKPEVLFWGQGEEDGMSETTAHAYRANLTNFFAAARSNWLSASDGKIAFFEVNTVSPYASEVRQAQVDVDAADPNAASFDTASYPVQSGEDHFTPAALNEVGQRFFDIYAGFAPPSPGGATTPPPSASGGGGPAPASGQIYTSEAPGSVLAGGSGDDTFNASQGYDTLTGGAGADVFNLPTEPWAPIHVTDFASGSDKLDLRALFRAVGYAGSDPVADHYLYVASDGTGGTIIRFDRDGPGDNPQWPNTIFDLEGVAPSQVSSSDWIIH